MNIIFKLIIVLFFISSASAEVIKFSSSTYTGEIKKGKAHGSGIMTFADGTKYIGQFKKNIIHGKGTYIDKDGNAISGKWKYGKITNKIDADTRKVVKLNRLTGSVNYFEKKGSGDVANLWFEAVPKVNNTEETQDKILTGVELDIFDTPSVFSDDYGNEEKLKEILDAKKENILTENFQSSENNQSSKITKNIKTVYVFSEKGQKNQQQATQVANNTSSHSSQMGTGGTSSSSMSSGGGGSGGGGSGGGGGAGC